MKKDPPESVATPLAPLDVGISLASNVRTESFGGTAQASKPDFMTSNFAPFQLLESAKEEIELPWSVVRKVEADCATAMPLTTLLEDGGFVPAILWRTMSIVDLAPAWSGCSATYSEVMFTRSVCGVNVRRQLKQANFRAATLTEVLVMLRAGLVSINEDAPLWVFGSTDAFRPAYVPVLKRRRDQNVFVWYETDQYFVPGRCRILITAV